MDVEGAAWVKCNEAPTIDGPSAMMQKYEAVEWWPEATQSKETGNMTTEARILTHPAGLGWVIREENVPGAIGRQLDPRVFESPDAARLARPELFEAHGNSASKNARPLKDTPEAPGVADDSPQAVEP